MSHQEPIVVVAHQFLDAAEIRADHGRSSPEGFEHNERPGLQPLRWNCQHIKPGEKGGNFRMRRSRKKADALIAGCGMLDVVAILV